MQTVENSSKYIEGVFVKELKNRFLCEVLINGESTVCYVPSSCHLSNFLDLKGKTVLLIPTQTPKSRTSYALFAVPFKRNYLILNTSMANSAIVNSLNSRRFSYLGKRKTILTEHKIDDYKTDIYIKDTNTVVEIKSIISTNSPGIFPTVYSERTLQQLSKIQELLSRGYKVCFMIVSLNPYLKEIRIDEKTEFFSELSSCIEKGMAVKAYSCKFDEDQLLIRNEIPIKYNVINSCEKINRLEFLLSPKTTLADTYYDTLVDIGAIKYNYYDFMITEPINADKELERLSSADYDLCCALITMLLREDHFSNGAFGERFENGEVTPIIEKMIAILKDTVED